MKSRTRSAIIKVKDGSIAKWQAKKLLWLHRWEVLCPGLGEAVEKDRSRNTQKEFWGEGKWTVLGRWATCEIRVSHNPQGETGLWIKVIKLSFGKSGFICLLNTLVKILKALLFNRNIMNIKQTINASQRHNLKFYSSHIKKEKRWNDYNIFSPVYPKYYHFNTININKLLRSFTFFFS